MHHAGCAQVVDVGYYGRLESEAHQRCASEVVQFVKVGCAEFVLKQIAIRQTISEKVDGVGFYPAHTGGTACFGIKPRLKTLHRLRKFGGHRRRLRT